MNKYIFIAILLFSIKVFSQENLYMPFEFQKAYDRETRSIDGNPGKNYWQNHSDYKIEADFNTSTRTLSGKENISYYNESPDKLEYFIIRLYQNLNKPESSKDWEYTKKSFSDGVKIKSIKINGEAIDLEKQTSCEGTNLTVKYSINPGIKTDIYVEWSICIPEGNSPRMGRYDSTTYLLAYWYPQISVYDDIDGWDNVDYTGQVEFYNDFSNFDVTLSIDNPDCIVWATGTLQNPEQIFSEKYLNTFRSKEENKIINFVNNENIKDKILLNKEKISWHYKAENVPDFVFSFSNHYYWDFVNVKVEPDRLVKINTVYNPNSKGFDKVCQIAKDAITYYSYELPGIPFPYPNITVFNGDGGMEFPMMVNDRSTESFNLDVYITSHEICHTYFPFYMGTNERKYAWLDEGMAVFLPQDLQTKLSIDSDLREKFTKRYLEKSGTLLDVPLMVQSHQLRGLSYRFVSYHKASCTFNILKDILGKDLFVKCLHEFMKKWNGKHPTPYDFFNTFKNTSGQNLDWFFKPWYFEFGYPDLGIADIKTENGKYKIVIEKIGNYPVPVYIKIKTENDNEIEINESAKIWSNGVNKVTFEKQAEGDIKSVELGNKYIPDANLKNNNYIIK